MVTGPAARPRDSLAGSPLDPGVQHFQDLAQHIQVWQRLATPGTGTDGHTAAAEVQADPSTSAKLQRSPAHDQWTTALTYGRRRSEILRAARNRCWAAELSSSPDFNAASRSSLCAVLPSLSDGGRIPGHPSRGPHHLRGGAGRAFRNAARPGSGLPPRPRVSGVYGEGPAESEWPSGDRRTARAFLGGGGEVGGRLAVLLLEGANEVAAVREVPACRKFRDGRPA